MMEVGEVIREIGRGKQGARGISAGRSFDLFKAMLAGQVDELGMGAVLMAFRMKGETEEEMLGALSAAQLSLARVPTNTSKPVVIIPSYNGARNMANLTPLLAGLLADAGLQVIVHGIELDAKRTTSAQIMAAMGLPALHDIEEAAFSFDRNDPVFIPIELLSPALNSMLSLRTRMGVRNTAHSLVKLIDPSHREDSLRLTAYTHPEFDVLQHKLFAQMKASALIMRATEGEVVANAKRQARIDWMSQGDCFTLVQADTSPLREVPILPAAHDASATARWIQSVLAGERSVPALIDQQVRLIIQRFGVESARSSAAAPGYSGPVLDGIRL
jgi:anthranilate phosphoribosyltransferase